jgi:hypothetical protein
MIATLSKIKMLAVHGAAACLLLGTSVVTAQVPAAANNAGEALVTKRQSSLRQEPSESSRSLQTLPLQTQLTRLGDKQGAWIKVSLVDSSQGWVHMFDVTTPAAASSVGSTGAGVLRSVTSFLNRGSAQPRNNVSTATVGIRGLNAQDIANATPNTQALQRAESFQLGADQANRFASAASLSRQSVADLPVPTTNTEAKP